jgi:PAS domain S-box-containing protein
MAWIHLPYVVPLVISGVVAALIGMYAWRRRDTPGGGYFVLLMAVIVWWSLTNAAEYASLDISTKIVWSKLSYLSIVSVGSVWLLFALEYSQRNPWFTRWRGALLWIVPLLLFLTVITNEWHGLIWPTITPASSEPGAMLVYGHGPGVWANAVYSYGSLLLGTVLLIRATLRSPQLYRRQVAVLMVAVVVPWLGNVVYILDLLPLPGLDPTPIAFTVSGAMVAWAIFRFQMLDLVPVARDTVIESIGDGVLVLDAHNRLADINPAACRMIGCDAVQVVGQHADTVLARWPDLVAHYRESPEAQAEIVLDGPPRQWVDLHISPLYDRRRRLTGRLVVLHDITARKEAEGALQQYAAELEARNAELDAFAHTVAHDLKSPLTAVVGFGTLLESRCGTMRPEQMQQHLQALTQAGKKMANIIDELLLLASVRKMEQVQTGPLDMGSVVAEARQRLAGMIVECQAEIIVPEAWPEAIGYAPWVEEVWTNYLSNALQYGGQPPRVELGYDRPAAGNFHVRFWVRDNGLGLTPDMQSRLFAEFSRLDQVQAKGHGLGLSIVRRIVEKLGGQVGVESRVGQGSTFYFTLLRK